MADPVVPPLHNTFEEDSAADSAAGEPTVAVAVDVHPAASVTSTE